MPREIISAIDVGTTKICALIAGVTHDINTPVGIAVTAASNMREEAARLHQALEAQRLKRSELAQFVALAQQSSAMIETNLQRASHLLRSFKQVAVDQVSLTVAPGEIVAIGSGAIGTILALPLANEKER